MLNINSRKEPASSSFNKCKILFSGSISYNRELISCQSKLLWEQPLERKGCEQQEANGESLSFGSQESQVMLSPDVTYRTSPAPQEWEREMVQTLKTFGKAGEGGIEEGCWLESGVCGC